MQFRVLLLSDLFVFMTKFSIFNAVLGTRYSVLFCFCLILLTSKISAQVVECGVPDMPYSVWQQKLSGCSNPQLPGAGNWDVPIWVTIVRQTNGYSHLNDVFAPKQIIGEVNSYFDNGIQFYVCGVTYLNSDQFYDLKRTSDVNGPSEVPGLEAAAHALNPVEYPKGYVDVFFLGSMIPGGDYCNVPSGNYRGSILMTDFDGNSLAHELGHYFGLPHTFQGGVSTIFFPNNPEFVQYVHPGGLPVVLSTGTFGCDETGDYICDTPADPRQCSVNFPQCDFLGCSAGFTHDPLGVAYAPDITLLMSYYGCRNRFTNDQSEIMVGMLTGHPDWAFLNDNEIPNCQELPYDKGLLVRNCEGIMIGTNQPAPTQTPMEEVEVSMENINNFSCGDFTDNNGVYQTFICLTNPLYVGPDLLSLIPDVEYLNPLEGVDVGDLQRISKHILGIEPFESPFQIIAADANNSGSVTTFDIVELRKLTLGIYDVLPNNSSFRYVPDYCFEDNAFYNEFYDPPPFNQFVNPFDAKWTNPDEPAAIPPATNERSYGGGGAVPNANSWMDHVSINPIGQIARNTTIPWSFTGIKVGDVNCDAVLPFASEAPDKNFTTLGHTPLITNQIFTLHIKASGSTPISAWQLGVDFAEDSLQILQIQSGNTSETFSLENFGITNEEQGEFRALNFSENGTGQNLNGKTLFKLVIKALNPIPNIGQRFRLRNAILPEKFYTTGGEEVENIGLYLEVVNGSNGLGLTSNVGNVLKDISEDVFSVSAYPVPFTSEVNFDFLLATDEKVKVSLFDSFGRLLTTRSESFTKGPNSMSVSGLSEHPNGLYWYSFTVGGRTFFDKIVKK